MVIFLLLLAAIPLSAGTYWVSPTGAAAWGACESATPLSGTAACARTTANTSAMAGDIVYFRSGTYALAAFDGGIIPTNSGSSGNMITFSGYADEEAVITQTDFTGSTSYGIYLAADSYIKITKLKFQNIGTYAYIVQGSHHNEISYNTFYNDISQRVEGVGTTGIIFSPSIGGSCGTTKDCWNTHNWVHHNTISDVWNSTICGEGTDLIRIGATWTPGHPTIQENYNTIENNVLSHAAHTILDSYGSYTVIANNVFHNEPFQSGCVDYLKGTSVSSLAVGTGPKSLTIETGLSITNGSLISIIQTSNPANTMSGTVTSYTSGTGALIVDATYSIGSGTHADWTISQGFYPYYTNSAYNGKFGHRNLHLSDDFARLASYQLVEGNRLGHASANPGNAGPMGIDVAAPGNLVRYNFVYSGMASGIYFKYATSLYSGSVPTSTTSNTIGNGSKTFTTQAGLSTLFVAGGNVRIWATDSSANGMYGAIVSYDNATGELEVTTSGSVGSGTFAAWTLIGNGASGGVLNRVFNNTIYRNGQGYDWKAYAAYGGALNGRGIAQYNANTTGTVGNKIKNNLLYDNGAGDICSLGLTISCTNEVYDTVSNNWLHANGDPAFVNPDVSDATSLTLPNLALQSSSPAINGGTYLTQASGSGESSTTLVVDDALYFQDGTWGSDLARGVTLFPDEIAIGTVGNTVAVSSINYTTNTITLASAKTWLDDAPIWLYKKSDGAVVLVGSAPDYGASEYVNTAGHRSGSVSGGIQQ